MKNSPHNKKHQIKKAIRQAQDLPLETDPKAPSKDTIKKYFTKPSHTKRVGSKLSSTHGSKRTSPQDTGFETEPESIHPEGAKWNEVLNKQSKENSHDIQRKMNKTLRKDSPKFKPGK
ncbi:MAG: hypothetical protein KAR79_00085 [Simkaniaceae bacterium]|nr:hypothetical protein [Simkaniaceae bacterium]